MIRSHKPGILGVNFESLSPILSNITSVFGRLCAPSPSSSPSVPVFLWWEENKQPSSLSYSSSPLVTSEPHTHTEAADRKASYLPPSSNSHLFLLKHVRSHFLQSSLCVLCSGAGLFSSHQMGTRRWLHQTVGDRLDIKKAVFQDSEGEK